MRSRGEEPKPPRYDDVLVVKGTRNKRQELPVFERNVYPKNHSHPVKAVPPLADVGVQGKKLAMPCPSVRMVRMV